MTLIYPRLSIEIELSAQNPYILSIENPWIYTEFMQAIINQSEGGEGVLHLLEHGVEKKISKEVCVIANPLMTDCNEKKILNKLYAQMADICVEQFIEKKIALNAEMVSFIDSLSGCLPYHIGTKLDFNISDILKIYEVKLDYNGTTLLERLTDYVRVQHQIMNVSIFVIIGLKDYLTCEELQLFYRMSQYEQISLLILEGLEHEQNVNEKGVVIDKDQCIIKL